MLDFLDSTRSLQECLSGKLYTAWQYTHRCRTKSRVYRASGRFQSTAALGLSINSREFEGLLKSCSGFSQTGDLESRFVSANDDDNSFSKVHPYPMLD